MALRGQRCGQKGQKRKTSPMIPAILCKGTEFKFWQKKKEAEASFF